MIVIEKNKDNKKQKENKDIPSLDGEQDNEDSSTTPVHENKKKTTNTPQQIKTTNTPQQINHLGMMMKTNLAMMMKMKQSALMMKAKQSGLKRMTMKMKNKQKMKTTLGHNKQKKDAVVAQRKEGGSLYKKTYVFMGSSAESQ